MVALRLNLALKISYLILAALSFLFTARFLTRKISFLNLRNFPIPPRNDWIVVVTVSEGFDDMFQNWWLWYLDLGLDMPVVMYAEDEGTYTKYNSSATANFTVVYGDESHVEGPQSYGSDGFISLVARRPRHILDALARSAKVIYTDIDTVWLADPRPYFTGNYDAWVQIDRPHPFLWCSCFMAFVNSPSSIELLRTWHSELERNPEVDQLAFNRLMRRGTNANLKALPLEQFPPGPLYFEEKLKEGVAVVHNNWIRGKEKKVQRYIDEGLWRVTS